MAPGPTIFGAPVSIESEKAAADPNDAVEFGDGPVDFVKCPHCGASDMCTYVEYEASCITYILAFCFLFMLGTVRVLERVVEKCWMFSFCQTS